MVTCMYSTQKMTVWYIKKTLISVIKKMNFFQKMIKTTNKNLYDFYLMNSYPRIIYINYDKCDTLDQPVRFW